MNASALARAANCASFRIPAPLRRWERLLRLAHFAHHVPQDLSHSVNLVEQAENHIDTFVVHAEIVLQIADELRARQVGLRKMPPVLWALFRTYPARRDPCFEPCMVDAGGGEGRTLSHRRPSPLSAAAWRCACSSLPRMSQAPGRATPAARP